MMIYTTSLPYSRTRDAIDYDLNAYLAKIPEIAGAEF